MPNEINVYLLVMTLIAASYFDIKERRIPNILTLPVILWGLVSASIISGFNGFQFSLFGFLVGMAVFFIPFALNFMGAGDVKLMGVVGALMGWKFTMSALLYAALAGGVVVLVVSIYNKRFFKIILAFLGLVLAPLLNKIYEKTLNKTILKTKIFLTGFKFDKKKEYIPYGVAIAIGTLLVLSGAVQKII